MSRNEPPRAHRRAKEPEGIRLAPGESRSIEVSKKPPQEKIGTTSDWEELKRWIRWNVVCRRGRKCAEIEISPIAPELAALDEFKALQGKEIFADYICQGCGTRYRFSSKTGRRRR